MYHLKIDDKEIEVPEGTTVLNAARLAEIEIPTLCDHPALEPYGGCRLCLVEVEGARTLQPACTLPASNNMVVKTQTEKVKSARKFVLSMIFSERNHFCPFCQVSGGDCELQNAAYDEDMTHWPLQPNWKPFEVDASHPFFVLDHNRCILCRRCVRACDELVGNFTLGMEERGSNTLLVADLGIPLGSSSCVSCGTCVQICPTGALIDRWSAYRGHESDVTTTDTICVGCSIGCGIQVISRNNSLVRIDGNWDAEINSGVICEVGRFLPMVEKRERVLTPLIRKNGTLKAATWEEAINSLTKKIKPLIGQKENGIAAIISTRLPSEALYSFKQLFSDKIGSTMVTSTEEGHYTSAEVEFSSEAGFNEGTLKDIESGDVILTIGTDLTKNHQVAGFFAKRIIKKGTKVIPVNYEAGGMDAFTPYSTIIKKNSSLDFIKTLESVIVNQSNLENQEFTDFCTSDINKIVNLLADSKNPVIVVGSDFAPNQQSKIFQSILNISKKINAKIVNLKGFANSLSAYQYGLDKQFKLNNHNATYIVIGDEDPSNSLIQKVENSPNLFVQASYHSSLTAKADVVLPVTNWLEQEGHYLNTDGKVQKSCKSLESIDNIKSNLDVLELLSQKLNIQLEGDWKSDLSK